MKKTRRLMMVLLCFVVTLTMGVMVSCNKKPQAPAYEKPVIIGLPKDVETSFVTSYTLPQAKAKSVVNKRKSLDVVITCVDPDGKDVEVNNRNIKVTKLGTYIAKYNATDIEPSLQKADEVQFKVTFVDDGVIINEKPQAEDIAEKTSFDKFAIPAFTDVAEAEYQYKGLKTEDFDITATAKFNSISGESVLIEDLNKVSSYDMGEIIVSYHIVAKSDNTITKDYDFRIFIGNAIMNDYNVEGNDVEVSKELIQDPNIYDKDFIRMTLPGNASWKGGEFVDPCSVMSAVNEVVAAKQDKYLVINTHNPLEDENVWLIVSMYDIDRYGGSQDTLRSYTQVYRIHPNEYVDVVVPLKHFAYTDDNYISKISFSVAGGETNLESGDINTGKTLDLLDIDIVDADKYTTKIDINADSTIKMIGGVDNATAVYDEAKGGIVFTNTPVAAETPEVAAEEENTEPELPKNDVSVDLVSLNAKATTDLFLNARHPYQNVYAVDLKNLTENEIKVWFRLGQGQNNPISGDAYKYLLNDIVLRPNESITLYQTISSRNYDFHRLALDFLNINIEDAGSILISNPRIVNFPYLTTPNAPASRFDVSVKEDMADNLKRWVEGNDYTLPNADQVFNFNQPLAEAKVISVIKDGETESIKFTDKLASADFVDGIYTITYKLTEKGVTDGTTGESKIISYSINAVKTTDAYLRADSDIYTVINDLQYIDIPAFDDVFILVADHSAKLNKVEFAPSKDGEFTAISSTDALHGRIGAYKVTYDVTFTDTAIASKQVELLIDSVQGFNSAAFVARDSNALPTVEDIVENDKVTGVRISGIDTWNGAKLPAGSELMNAFHEAKADEGLKLTVKNESANVIKTRFFMNQEQNNNASTNAQTLELAANGVGVIYFKNDNYYNFGSDNLEFWVDTADTTLTITAEIVKESNVILPLFNANKNGAEIAAAMSKSNSNAPLVSYADGKFTVDSSKGDTYIDFMNLGKYSSILKYNYSRVSLEARMQQVLALDVKYLDATEGANPDYFETVWFGAGIDRNSIYDNNTRAQKVSKGDTRTVIIPIGLLANSGTDWYAPNCQTGDPLNYVQLNLNYSKVEISNARILNFANLNNQYAEDTITEFTQYEVPAYGDLFYTTKEYTETVKVEFSTTKDGKYTEVVEGTLNGRVGFYKVTYDIKFTDGTTTTAQLDINSNEGISIDNVKGDDGVEVTDYLVDGKKAGLQFNNIVNRWRGATFDEQSFIAMFNNMYPGWTLNVTVTNTSDKTYGNSCFYFDTDKVDALNQRANLAPGESKTLKFDRRNYEANVGKFIFWLDNNDDETPYSIALSFEICSPILDGGIEYVVPAYEDLYPDAKKHTVETKLSYCATESGEFTPVEKLVDRVGFYKVEYVVSYADGKSRTVSYMLQATEHSLITEFIARDGSSMPDMADYVVDGHNKGIIFSNITPWNGAKLKEDSNLMKAFKAMTAEQGLRIKVTNLSGNVIKTRFFFNDQLNTNAQILELEDNGVGYIYFRNDGEYVNGEKALEFWAANSASTDENVLMAKVQLEFEVINEKDYEVKLFDEANKGAEIAAAMSTNPEGNAPAVTFENGKFTIDALAGDRYVNLLALGNYSKVLTRFYANTTLAQRRQQVLAVDIQLVSGESDVWFGFGLDGNCINDDPSRIQKIYTDKTRTIYLPFGILSPSGSNYTNSQVEGNFAWVKLDVYLSKIVASNFRVLNFAGIIPSLEESVTTTEFANYVVPDYDKIFIDEKAHTASVVNVEYSDTENGAFNTIKATTLNKVGFYKVTYKVDYNDGKSNEATLTVKVLEGLSADMLNNDAGEKSDYVVDGKHQGVKLTNITTAFGGGAVSNADFINRFNSMTDKEVLKVTVKNIGKNAYSNSCFFFDNTNTDSLNFRATLAPNGSKELFIKRNMYAENVQAFKFWLDGPSAETPFDIAIDFNFYNDTINELTQYNVVDYKTLFADDTDAQSATYTVSYKANDYAPSQVVEGSVLTGKTGVYTISYTVTNTDGSTKYVDYLVYSMLSYGAKEWTTDRGHISDYTVDGVVKGIHFDIHTAWGATTLVKESPMMQAFAGLTSNQGLKITVTSDTDAAFKLKSFLNEQENVNAQAVIFTKKGMKAVMYYMNDNAYTHGKDCFAFWTDTAAAFDMTFEIIDEKDVAVSVFGQLDKAKGEEIAGLMAKNAQNNAPESVTYADGVFTIDALAGDRYVNLLELGAHSDIIKKYYANITLDQRLMQVFAVDVKLVEGATKIWVGTGLNENGIVNATSREQAIELGNTRTIYIPMGLLCGVGDEWRAPNQFLEGNFNWVKLDVYQSKVEVSNIRVLNFADIK